VVDDQRLALAFGPADGQDVEARGSVQEAVVLQEVQGQAGEALLLHGVDRRGGAGGIGAGRGAHFDEDDARAVERDQIEFAVGTRVVALEDAIAEALQEASGGTLGTGAEPATPPGKPGYGKIRNPKSEIRNPKINPKSENKSEIRK
jgi:hypothetical protein